MTFTAKSAPSSSRERACRAPEPAPARRLAGLARRLFGAGVLLAACTLTSEDFEPSLVGADNLRPDAGALAPEPGPVCAPGEECCEAAPCPGEAICQAGLCRQPAPLADAGEPPCEGTDCSPPPPVLLTPSCDDGQQNGDEEGVDCGGSCALGCVAASSCSDGQQNGDEAGVDCGGSCPACPPPPPACTDGVQNGGESAVDCGGDECPRCGVGQACDAGSDCATGVCGGNGACAPPSCADGVRNGFETGVDCGANCPANCGTGEGCGSGFDCQSGVCGGACPGPLASCCQAPSCSDGVQNGGEPSLDCGNLACGPCPLGRPCFANAQCASGLCQLGECSEPGSCTDGVQNGLETGLDCGGGVCPRCPDLQGCNQPSDCNNNNCDFRGVCISCGDNVLDGTETGVDCGGADPFCRRCNPGEACLINSDCIDGTCFAGFC